MRAFVDINIKPPLEDKSMQEKMANLAHQLGLGTVCLRFKQNTPSNEIKSSVKIFSSVGLDVAIGLDLFANSRKQLLKQLNTSRRFFEILAVNCKDVKTTMVAAHDRRVDLISLEGIKSIRTKQSIIKSCKTNIEFELMRILMFSGRTSLEQINYFGREIELANRYKVNIVVSSGAEGVLSLRAPRDIAALANTLGLPNERSLDSVSKIPMQIIRDNRNKLYKNSLSQ
ncbi:RNase P subunit p30 family protein [[Eubacterium] cellulosolvens]